MKNNRLKLNEIKNLPAILIIAGGVLLRLVYVLRSTIYDRQYDIGMIDLDAGHTVSGGHLAYIQYLYENFRLPDADPTTIYQFHHPPFHHFVSALWMRFVSLFTSNTDIIEESMQVIPFICSLVILLTAALILKQFRLGEKAFAFGMTVFSFHPSLILLSGSVNNDAMSLMFTFLCILFAMKWINEKSFSNIIFLAVFLGLGISSKQNVAELAFPLAAVFIIVFIKAIVEKKNPWKLVLEYALFGVISIPLGMWFFIRNLIRYNVSMLWVYELPTDSWQYTGNVPVINRFLWPIPSEMIENLKNFKIGCGYNVWMQLMRTSVLGEWDMAAVGKGIKVIAVLLMLVGALLAIEAFICFVKTFVAGKGLSGENVMLHRVLFIVSYVVVMLFYLVFAYKYPQQCSMHFRYIEITILFPTVGFAVVYDGLKSKLMRYFLNLCVGAFAFLGTAMCCVWCF